MVIKNRFLLLCGLLLMAVLAPRPADALDVGATYRIESLAFDKDRKQTDTSFSGYNFPMGFSLYARQTLEDNLTVSGEYVYDNVLRNILTGLITYKGNLFSFGVGPFLGFLNTDRILPTVGVASFFKVEWPGIAFVELWLDNSSGSLSDTGDTIQERTHLAAGWYVPGVICTVAVSRKRYIEQTETAEITDILTEYSFSTDIFQKNVPFKVLISFALQDLSREFEPPTGGTDTHSLFSLLLGTRFDFEVSDGVTLLLDMDHSIYSFGQDELLGISNPGPGGYLFRAVTGVRVNVDTILARRRAATAP